jgi:hypothetical protein
MSPDTVVIGLDIFKYLLLRLISGEICVLLDQFGFDGFEKRLSHRIFPAVSFAARALHEAMMIERFGEATTGILHSTVGMNNQVFWHQLSPHGPLKSLHDHLMSQRGADRPAHHGSGKQVDKHCQIQPILASPDVCYIANPDPVGTITAKISLQQVICNRILMPGICRNSEFSPGTGTQSHLPHPSGYPATADIAS